MKKFKVLDLTSTILVGPDLRLTNLWVGPRTCLKPINRKVVCCIKGTCHPFKLPPSILPTFWSITDLPLLNICDCSSTAFFSKPLLCLTATSIIFIFFETFPWQLLCVLTLFSETSSPSPCPSRPPIAQPLLN